MKTLFQKIIEREIPSTIVFENDEIIAIEDINPSAPVHILIIPKKPIPSIVECEKSDEGLLGRLILTAQDIAKQKKLEGYKLNFNVGKKGGQEIFHLHLHLLGGWKN